MAITVKYFAVLRERLGKSEDTIAFVDGMKVSDVLKMTTAGRTLPENLKIAVNMEYTRLDTPLHDGDEVAFFPAVTGG
jgi:molybdopterin synthase sulfur carrier subunit